MKRVIAGLTGLALCAGASAAQSVPDSCGAGEGATGALFPMPLAAKALASGHQLNILVLGAGSSTLPGPDGAKRAYPARLQVALAKKWPKSTVKVATDTGSRRTAAEMVKNLKADLARSKASLVVWQTGTADAVRGVDPESFAAVLDRGIDIARGAGADVVLVNMQYSPLTESMIAVGRYADAMHWVALQREVSLFDRFAVMKSWSALGIFDLRQTTKKLDTAQAVHNCVGYLLADLVNEAVLQAGKP